MIIAFRRDRADSAARGFADGENPYSRRGEFQGQGRKSFRRRGDGSGFAAGPGQGIEIADRPRAGERSRHRPDERDAGAMMDSTFWFYR